VKTRGPWTWVQVPASLENYMEMMSHLMAGKIRNNNVASLIKNYLNKLFKYHLINNKVPYKFGKPNVPCYFIIF